MLEPKNGEDFWIGLVEDHAKLGYVQNIVPGYSFSYETAKSVAERLKVKLEVRGTDYVFIQKK
jgi:hypothetical protein